MNSKDFLRLTELISYLILSLHTNSVQLSNKKGFIFFNISHNFPLLFLSDTDQVFPLMKIQYNFSIKKAKRVFNFPPYSSKLTAIFVSKACLGKCRLNQSPIFHAPYLHILCMYVRMSLCVCVCVQL